MSDFDLNEIQPGPPYSDFTWWINCGAETVYFGSGYDGFVNLINEEFPEDCGDPVSSENGGGFLIDLYGMTETPCGTESQLFEIHTNQGDGDVCGALLPNVITPYNGDGVNNALKFLGLDNYTNNGEYAILRVYDRWGNMVYEDESFDNEDPWYGTNQQGTNLSEGTYFYTLYISLIDEEKHSPVSIFRN